jgi:O-antigen/teichoic acid export membrane protein
MKSRNIKVNAVLNSIKTLMTILFPLITTSYLSRVLGKDGYGMFNYSVSIVSYFILIAGLGINTYGIREGAKVRDNRVQESQFSSELFTLNILSTIISYACLFLLLIFSKSLLPYRIYIIVISITIAFTTLGADWINSIYEDFWYLTLRYIIVQVVSIFLMLIFVRNKEDLLKYVGVYLFSQVGANVANIFYIRRYVRLRLVINKSVFSHLIPVLILFASSVAVTIYVNSDITILGIIKGDEAVGVYSVASRIYTGAKQIATAGTVVAIPRLAFYIGQKNKEEYNLLLENILNLLISVTIPLFTGLFMISHQVMLIIGGVGYDEGAITLQILSLASIFSIVAYYYAQCILIPNFREKYFLIATVIAALINIVGNFIVIPFWSHIGAALTTLISEFFTMAFCAIYSRGYHGSSLDKKAVLSTIASSCAVIIVCSISGLIIKNYLLSALVSITISAIAFLAIMEVMKNKYVTGIFDSVIRKIKK